MKQQTRIHAHDFATSRHAALLAAALATMDWTQWVPLPIDIVPPRNKEP